MREGGRDAVWRDEFSVCVWTWSTSRLFWRLQEGHSTIAGPEQRAVVNEMCRYDRRGTPDVQRSGRCVGSDELLNVSGGWSLDCLVCKHQCLEFDASHNRQPVEVSEQRGGVRISGHVQPSHAHITVRSFVWKGRSQICLLQGWFPAQEHEQGGFGVGCHGHPNHDCLHAYVNDEQVGQTAGEDEHAHKSY